MTYPHKIISSKLDNNMMDRWTGYLLLVRHLDGTFEIGGAQYEILCLANDFLNEADELVIPPEIGGKRVIGIEDGYVVGGELSLEFSQYTKLRFSEPNKEEIVNWLASEGWGLDTLKEIESAVRELTQN